MSSAKDTSLTIFTGGGFCIMGGLSTPLHSLKPTITLDCQQWGTKMHFLHHLSPRYTFSNEMAVHLDHKDDKYAQENYFHEIRATKSCAQE